MNPFQFKKKIIRKKKVELAWQFSFTNQQKRYLSSKKKKERKEKRSAEDLVNKQVNQRPKKEKLKKIKKKTLQK